MGPFSWRIVRVEQKECKVLYHNWHTQDGRCAPKFWLFLPCPIGSTNQQACWLSWGGVQALQHHWKPLPRTLVQELRPAVESHANLSLRLLHRIDWERERNSPVFPVFQLSASWGLGAEAKAAALILYVTRLLASRADALLTSGASQPLALQLSSMVLSCEASDLKVKCKHFIFTCL